MRHRWNRLIRFISNDGKVYNGDAILAKGSGDVQESRFARLIRGDPFGSYTFGPVRPVLTLLSPMQYNKIKTVRLLGINYRQHAAETGIPLPKYPILITKPATAISGPIDNIPVGEMAREEGAIDYEVELVVVIGRQCKNVTPEEALDYVLGYTVGNDVSQREWQMKRGGGQWNVSKGFDAWAPIGPAIVSPQAIGDAGKLRIQSWVNREPRQDSNTSDMNFGIASTISFLSKASTLMPGDLLFMGTPSGVGLGFNPPKYLKDGDIVECAIEGIGSIKNKVVFTDDSSTRNHPTFQQGQTRNSDTKKGWNSKSRSTKL